MTRYGQRTSKGGNAPGDDYGDDDVGVALKRIQGAFDSQIDDVRHDIVLLSDRMAKHGSFAIHTKRERNLIPGVVPDDPFSNDGFAQDFAEKMIELKREPAGTMLRVCSLSPYVDTGGAATLREEMGEEILEHLERVGDIYRDAGKIPLGALKRTIPRVTNDVEFSFVTAGADAQEADPTFGAIVMQASEAAGYLEIPNAMLEDATPGLGNFIATRLIRGATRFRENMLVNGDGSPAHGGIVGLLNSNNVTVVNMGSGDTDFQDIELGDLISLEEYALDDGEDNESAYYFSRSILANLKRLTDTTGQPVWSPAAGPTPPMVNGHRYVTSPRFPKNAASAISTKFAVFGNLRKGLLVGDRAELQIGVSTDYKFRQRMTAYVVVLRFDAVCVPGSVAGENPLTALKTAAT